MSVDELGSDPEAIVVRVKYKAPKPLDEIAHGILPKALQTRLLASQLRSGSAGPRTP
jgi:hypothetical protein